ncbi:hypothetical protein LRP50_20255 [Enterovibrio sp. ZSDZ42]|uniref:Calx-beta domain-containing protein n=1 Tax=Enterovibrio gelatinilyticus TaxID=2899819 RepID=A0ABT5R5D8_9GAMM|nr:hypothetical protein [Enterovibrio sp. ZSDZ42]MDD1795468.1 hypothetical protein [Enterovibrio sp. ZSDZ42]
MMKKSLISIAVLAGALTSAQAVAECSGNVYSMNAGRNHVGILLDVQELDKMTGVYVTDAVNRSTYHSRSMFSGSAMSYDRITDRIYYANATQPTDFYIDIPESDFTAEEYAGLDLHSKKRKSYQLAYMDPTTGNHVAGPTVKKQIMRMAFHPDTGELFASNATAIFKVDPETGETTDIGTFDSNLRFGGYSSWGSFVFYEGELLFVTNGRTFEIDTATGAQTLKAFHFIDFVAAATLDQNGQMLVAAKNQNVTGNVNSNFLYRIEPSTGERVKVGLFPSRISGMATVTSETHTCYPKTIFPSELNPEVSGITLASASVSEGSVAYATINFDGETTGTAATVSLALKDGTAALNSDYRNTVSLRYSDGTTGTATISSTLTKITLPKGITSVRIDISTVDDETAENSENFTIEAWTKDDKSDLSSANIVIADDDGSGTVTENLEGNGDNTADDSAYVTTTNPDGSYTVVWRGWDTNYHGNNKVYLQSFNADGTLKGEELTFGTRQKIESPQVTMLNDNGDMLVTWTGYNNSTSLNTHSYAQVIYADPSQHNGAAMGAVMDLGPSELRSVTSARSGNTSVIVWHNGFSLYMQLLDSTGNKVGGAQVVGSVSANSNGYPIVSAPEISVLDNGNYTIAWRQGSTGTATNIVMLSSSGSKIGSQQTLSIGGTDGNADKETNIVSIGNGKYAVVGASGGVVKVALMDATNNQPVANSIKTLTISGSIHNDMPSITQIGTAGQFVVVWRGIENNEWYTYMQHFGADGLSTQAVEKFKASGGHGPAKVAGVGTAGDYVVVWASIGDSQRYEVRFQKFNVDGDKVGNQMSFTGQNTNVNSLHFDITSVGDKGAFTITFDGEDSAENGGDRSIYVVHVDEYGSVLQP